MEGEFSSALEKFDTGNSSAVTKMLKNKSVDSDCKAFCDPNAWAEGPPIQEGLNLLQNILEALSRHWSQPVFRYFIITAVRFENHRILAHA